MAAGGAVPIFMAAIVPEAQERNVKLGGSSIKALMARCLAGIQTPCSVLHDIDELTETNAFSSHTLTHC